MDSTTTHTDADTETTAATPETDLDPAHTSDLDPAHTADLDPVSATKAAAAQRIDQRASRMWRRYPSVPAHVLREALTNPKTGELYRFARWDWKAMTRKPALRGWIHTVATPLSLAASIVLLVLAEANLKFACTIYLVSSLVLFGMSALYHMGSWPLKVDTLLRHFDHSNIFLLIAGTYTPISVGLLSRHEATILLWVVWVGAVAGIVISLLWPGAPRWLVTLLYVVLGWAALMYLPQMFAASQPAFWLLVAGGVSYTVGAVVYASKWPNPSSRYFGFHEVFHAWTVAAWACHCIAAYLAVLG